MTLASKILKKTGKVSEASDKDYSKIFVPGAKLTSSQLDGSQEEVDYMMDNHLTFSALIDDVVEVHLYNPGEFEATKTTYEVLSGWPAIMKDPKTSNLIRLESVYGFGPKENYILVKKAIVGKH